VGEWHPCGQHDLSYCGAGILKLLYVSPIFAVDFILAEFAKSDSKNSFQLIKIQISGFSFFWPPEIVSFVTWNLRRDSAQLVIRVQLSLAYSISVSCVILWKFSLSCFPLFTRPSSHFCVLGSVLLSILVRVKTFYICVCREKITEI